MTAAEKKVKIQMIITVACVLFALMLIIALITGLISLGTSSSRKKALEAKLLELDSKIAQNDSDINYYQSDEYIDRIAREYLNMQGKDEIVFIGK